MPCFTAYVSLKVMVCVACDMLFGACNVIVGTAWLKSEVVCAGIEHFVLGRAEWQGNLLSGQDQHPQGL